MFRIPSPLMSGGLDYETTVDADVYIGDLYTYLGNPSGPVNLNWLIDGADVGEIIISNSFASGSTFEFTLINGGRILGMGGAGGAGGNDLGATGTAGSAGGNGTPAIKSNGFPVFLNADAGYLLGGGGGGGGASYYDTGAGGDAGGGGGGGQGWGTAAGGAAGASIGTPIAEGGAPGTRTIAGSGGLCGGTSGSVSGFAGGDGGGFGWGGHTGNSSNLGLQTWLYYAGLGGKAGEAFYGYNGGSITFTGSADETLLRSQSRIKGETSNIRLNAAGFHMIFGSMVSGDSGITLSYDFLSTGNITKHGKVPLGTTTTIITDEWLNSSGTGLGANYEIRRTRGLAGDTVGGWDIEAAAAGSWVSLATAREWGVLGTYGGTGGAASLFEIRRSDVPSPADNRQASFWLRIEYEDDQ